MTAGAATRPPARARLDLGDGPRPLVEVLSRPDVLGKVDVRLPDGERRTVPARWLDPEDDAALDLLTSGDRGIQRAAAPAPVLFSRSRGCAPSTRRSSSRCWAQPSWSSSS